MAMTTVVQLISGLTILSIAPSAAVTCYDCTYDPKVDSDLSSSCHLLPVELEAALTCNGQFCQSILFTSSSGQSVPTVYRSCIDLPSNITVEQCLQYSRVLGIAFFLFENLCCYSVANTTGTYTHCFCQDDYCNYNVTNPALEIRAKTPTTPLSFQQEVLTQSPVETKIPPQSVTCYSCKYSSVNASSAAESTCREPFNATGSSTCSAKGCYNYAYVGEEQYVVIRGCDAVGNFKFQSDEQCLQYGQVYNATFFLHENQCCYTIDGRRDSLTVCYCYSDFCNTNVSRPILPIDASTTTSTPVTFSISTFLPTVDRNSTEADPLLPILSSKRYTPPFSRKPTSAPTKRQSKPTQMTPERSTREATPTGGDSRINTKTTFAPQASSISCYSCSFYPSSESANDSVCSGHSDPATDATCTGRACYFYASTTDQGMSVIYRECDKKGTVVFQTDEQCLQYSKVYSLAFFVFDQQCCYITDAFGVPVTVCFCNTELCNSNRFRPIPQTASTSPTAPTSTPIPDILPSIPNSTTTVTPLSSEVNITSAATLSTSLVTPSGSGLNETSSSPYNTSLAIPSDSGMNVTSTSGLWPSTVISTSLMTTIVTQSSVEMISTEKPIKPVSPTETSPSSALFSSTLRTSSTTSTTTTVYRSVNCYNCTYFPTSDLSGTSMCTDSAGSTTLATCSGRSCYTYTYISQQGVLVIFRACDKEGTLEFQSDEQCLQYSQIHHLTFFTFESQCCYNTDVSGRPVTVCFCNNNLCNSNRSRPTKKR